MESQTISPDFPGMAGMAEPLPLPKKHDSKTTALQRLGCRPEDLANSISLAHEVLRKTPLIWCCLLLLMAIFQRPLLLQELTSIPGNPGLALDLLLFSLSCAGMISLLICCVRRYRAG